MRVLFNPPEERRSRLSGGGFTVDERKEYIKLCNTLTSDNSDMTHEEYDNITKTLIKYVKRESNDNIDKLNIIDEKKSQMKELLNEIFKNVDHTDYNYIGRVNIVSLQCIILFTKYAIMDGLEGKEQYMFKMVFDKTAYSSYIHITKKGDWTDYKAMLKYLDDKECTNLFNYYYINNRYTYKLPAKTPYTSKNSKHLIKTKLANTQLIVVVDYLTLDEIITSFLNNVVYCGFTYKLEYADGYLFTPFEFMQHDSSHGNTILYICMGQNVIDFKVTLSFYNFCKETLSKHKVYSIQLIIFILFHETPRCYLNTAATETKLMELILHSRYTNLPPMKDRLLNENDLAKAIPKAHRGNWETILKYLEDCVKVYVEKYTEFETTSHDGGGSPRKASSRKGSRRKASSRKGSRRRS